MQRKVNRRRRPLGRTTDEQKRAEQRAEEALKWQRWTSIASIATSAVSLAGVMYALLRRK